MDKSKTREKILTLDNAFELLKDKCVINVDKFWTAPKEITDCIRRHNMQKQVIIKTYMKEKQLNAVSEVAADLPFMPILSGKRDLAFNKLYESKRLNLIGAEVCFDDDKSYFASDEFIDYLHKNNLKIWGNAIVYSYKDVLSGGHTDDAAVTGDMDYGWGWFAEKGFDIVQTDWVFLMKEYFKTRR